ncbi:MAG: polysaccharide biosynthesis C-terminal domain-containing protein, partial [Lentisphaeria bacterium]|nr:polysaccharide biosynthesis C-terminal domain-containing protein [Lentisphaeria bacterium]
MGSGKKYQIDMCHGPLFSKIVFFTIPLMMTNLLQLLFHAADLIVIGQFAPGESLAAVGATNGLTVLVLNIFFGLGTGINVLVARYTGAKDSAQVSRNVHTAAAVAVYWGIAMAIIGIFISKPMLRLMDTPDNIIDKAALYMWIYCAGMPFVIFYNFGSAILRAVGDTKRPMIYMLLAGILNVLLNLFFVLVFKMDVAGVALATKLSNILSAYLIWRVLRDTPDAIQIVWKK